MKKMIVAKKIIMMKKARGGGRMTKDKEKELGLEPSENVWVVVAQLLEMEYHIDRRLPLASGDRKIGRAHV